LNDLWKYDGYNWTWISGSNYYNTLGNYGVQGISSSSNFPGARYSSIGWIDSNNHIWLFGGYGYSSINLDVPLNDLWKFDGINWIWISGSSSINLNGIYGNQSVPSSSNIPGARYASTAWQDSFGNFWLFGGYGYDLVGNEDNLNDLWKYDGFNWTWIYGNNTISYISNNLPLKRSSTGWIDINNTIYIFGGTTQTYDGLNTVVAKTLSNDFWKFSLSCSGSFSKTNTLPCISSYSSIPRLSSSIPTHSKHSSTITSKSIHTLHLDVSFNAFLIFLICFFILI